MTIFNRCLEFQKLNPKSILLMRKFRPLLLTFALFLISTVISAQNITADLSYFPKKEFNDKIVEISTADNGNTFEKIVIDGFDSKIPFYSIKPKDRREDKYVYFFTV